MAKLSSVMAVCVLFVLVIPSVWHVAPCSVAKQSHRMASCDLDTANGNKVDVM